MPEEIYINKDTGKICRVTEDFKSWRSRPNCILTDKSLEELENHNRTLLGNMLQLRATGRPIDVIGNGPSAKDYVWDGEAIRIGVNAGNLVTDLDYLVLLDDPTEDDRDLNKAICEILQKRSSKLITRISLAMTTLYEYAWGAVRGVTECEFIPNIFWDKCSVHAALDIARNMKPTEIRLFGVDYKDRSHFYTGSEAIPADTKDQPNVKWNQLERHLDGFQKIANACKRDKIAVYNMNPDSLVKCFEFKKEIKEEIKPEEFKKEIKEERDILKDYCRFVIFYTPDEIYQAEARNCCSSLMTRSINYQAVPIKKQKDWIKTCMSRISLLDSIAQVCPYETIVLLDADMEMQNPPTELWKNFDYDVAVNHRPGLPENHEYSAGIVAFSESPMGREALSLWKKECEADRLNKGRGKPPECREQIYLKNVIEEIEKRGGRIKRLPEEYNCKPEFVRDREVYFIHNPASRKLKDK